MKRRCHFLAYKVQRLTASAAPSFLSGGLQLFGWRTVSDFRAVKVSGDPCRQWVPEHCTNRVKLVKCWQFIYI